MNPVIEPFDLHVPDEALDDLRHRLAKTRWPDAETVDDTGQGPKLEKLRALRAYWQEDYDWRPCEALLNGFGQYRTTIDGVAIHFLHVRSAEPNAVPLLMCHGWPGSVLEFRKLIGPLTDPRAHGADPNVAFDVIAPSMPGFGFSDKPTQPGWDLDRIADAYIALMSRLGYERWGMQGGDLGCGVSDLIARKAPPGCFGMHLNFAMFQPTPEEIAEATDEERAMLASAKEFWDTLSGYAKEQSTRPQTIGYSLADSPAGLAAWIYAMFQDTCGTPGDAEASFTYDEMLDNITLYWLSNTGASSARLYWELGRSGGPRPGTPDDPIHLPTGFTMFPKEHVRKSRRWVERRYTNVVHFDWADRGGHFGALEDPEAMIDQIRTTFRAFAC